MGEGIQETKDALEAVNLLSMSLIKIFKKHLGVVEIGAALLGDEELKAALVKAFDGISKIPDEVKDLDMNEGMELAIAQIQLIPKLIEVLKS